MTGLWAAALLACSGSPLPVSPDPAPEQPAPAPEPEPEPLADPTEPRYAASHILVAWDGAVRARAGTNRSEAEAEALARDLHRQIRGGADFDGLAAVHSDGPSAPRGGRIGVYRTGTMVPDFERAVAAAEVGGLGPVIRTPFGWHVVRRDAVQEARAAHILVGFQGAHRTQATRSRAEADERIAQAQAALAAGEDWDAVAAKYSDEQTGAAGGELGLVAPGQMVPAFEEALFALKPDAVSPVVETPYGLHLIRRLP